MRAKDERYMRLALRLAQKAKGFTSPNPCVGAVVVNRGKVVGTGYHRRAGGPHAEINALREAGKRAKGATLYVSLEPCGHYGRTPPCVDSIVTSGIKRVVAAMKDPNPLNDGKGLSVLRKSGLKVKVGVLEDEAGRLNEEFVKFVTKRIPYITVKVAQSLDGKIATRTGDSRWITSEDARRYAHKIRNQVDAILVGVRTVLKDDPLLTVRLKGKNLRTPARIVLDSKLKIPLNARLLNNPGGKVIIATTKAAPKKKIAKLQHKGAEVIVVNTKERFVDIKSLLKELGKREIAHILIEGGGETIASAIESRVADKILYLIAPKIIGGRKAPTSVEGAGINKIKDAVTLKDIEVKRIGPDILVSGRPVY